MLISKVLDEAGGEGRRVAGVEAGDHAPEYQTASELFELMTKNTPYDSMDDRSLSPRDLVLLYKNIDIGTKLMNNATGIAPKKPNQYVETVIYNDELESDSDLSEIGSAEDIFMINQERLDFLDDKSFEHLLSHKFGGLEIRSSQKPADYNKTFAFKDPYVTNQLKNLKIMGSSSDFKNIFPTSLIDYICCKRLEDNYNFYMDNIIQYVQHTIEHLKRISNGDYLTDRAKEKWREVNSKQQTNDTKVLATSTSIPLHVECKRNINMSLDDVVRSEVDIRSLSKILEKKIVLEIPKLLSGSFRLYSKRCSDNLFIRCQREKQTIDEGGHESRVDVVLQLQRSQTGQVMSKINSVIILRTTPSLDLGSKKILPLPYEDKNDETSSDEAHDSNEAYDSNETYDSNEPHDSNEPAINATIINNKIDAVVTEIERDSTPCEEKQHMSEYQDSEITGSILDSNDISYGEHTVSDNDPLNDNDYLNVSKSSVGLDKPMFPIHNEETAYNLVSPDELRIAMKRLSMKTSVLDETGEDLMSTNVPSKKRSPVRVRIKSPYENKSFLMEEKKRKRLLEIRERREKKKMALSENCKISKHKYGKGPMPQASNSVTKLSITNKSFYNSIYGQSLNVNSKSPKGGKFVRKELKNSTTPSLDICPAESIQEFFESPMLTPEKNNQKYINRSYYLDDAETEMMYTQLKPNDNSVSNSAASVFNSSLHLLTQLIARSDINLNSDLAYTDDKPLSSTEVTCSAETFGLPIADEEDNTSPTATTTFNDALSSKKNSSSDECRKSIDQVYSLIKKFGKSNGAAYFGKTNNVKFAHDANDEITGHSTIQATESGSSVKHHHVTTSNHINFSTDKKYNPNARLNSDINPATVVPKVVISSKLQETKIEDAIRKDTKRATINSPRKRIPENPMKAISQLLLQIDNVQKTRLKTVPEIKSPKRADLVPHDVKTRPSFLRRNSRLEMHLKHNDNNDRKKDRPHNSPKDNNRSRPVPPTVLARIPHHQVPVEDKHSDKIIKKKLADIIDEATEARGEAVRGPSKLNSRLNSLAQPKKSYVQAHREEYTNRYGKNKVADRLQKLAVAAVLPPPEKPKSPRLNSRNRTRRSGAEATSTASVKPPAPSQPHIVSRATNVTNVRRSTSSSPPGFRDLASHKHNVPGAPEPIKKLVPVESSVKFRRRPTPAAELLAGHSARAPLLPHDIELPSSSSSVADKESSELGNTLHRMIDSVLTSAPQLPPLSSLAESSEIASKSSGVTFKSSAVTSKSSEIDYTDNVINVGMHSESDYHIDILHDETLKTAVEAIDDLKMDTIDDDVAVRQPLLNDPRAPTSITEMKVLENALYRQISGTFQKRLRIKKLTLTPKHSTQQVLVLQSGDAGSLIVKSTVSGLKLNKCAESLHDLKVMPVLSNCTHLDWTFAQIPVQIASVGYAFPEYPRIEANSKAKIIKVSGVQAPEKTSQHTCASSKDIQRIKELYTLSDASVQIDGKEIAQNFEAEFAAAPVKNLNSHLMVSEIKPELDQTKISNDKLHVSEIVNKIESTQSSRKPDEDADKVETVSAKEKIEPAPLTDSVEYTTSLDMLVGILNEIQKITCQNQMPEVNNDDNSCAGSDVILNHDLPGPAIEKSDKACSPDQISMDSLENLRQLESNASIYTYTVSNDDEMNANNIELAMEDESTSTVFVDRNIEEGPTKKESDDKNNRQPIEVSKPTSVDKEVNANMCEEYVFNSTDVPSSLTTIAIIGTTVADCVLSGVTDPGHPLLSPTVADPHTICNTSFTTPAIKENIELPIIDVKEQHVLISRDKTDLNEKCLKKSITLIRNFPNVKIERSLIARSELRKYCVNNIDFDPMLKIKRDILVTVYSILVLTVFAALSFPELIMLQ